MELAKLHAKTRMGLMTFVLLLVLPTLAQTSLSPTYEISTYDPQTDAYQELRSSGQMQQVPEENVVLLYEVPTGNGVCIIEAQNLRNQGIVPDETDIPSDLVLWRLLPASAGAADDATWIEYPYLYNPQTDSIRYQCLGSATFALLRGTPQFGFNAGLSDSSDLGSTATDATPPPIGALALLALMGLGAVAWLRWRGGRG